MRKYIFSLILAVAVGVATFPVAAHADTVTDEASFVTGINTLRSGLGLPSLHVNQNLVDKARSWAQGMAAAGRIWHSTLSDGVTANWQKLGENVGMGGSVDGLQKAFIASPHHYENLVDPAFGEVGIGVVVSGDTMYVSEVFMQLMGSSQPVKVVVTATTAPPVPTTSAPRPTPPPKPVAPKPVVAPKPATVPVPPVAAPVAPAAPAAPAAPVVELIPPPAPPRAPSALLVSVLERLRTFDA